MAKRNEHKYMGELICRSSYQGSKRWYVQSYHHTGIPYGEQDCVQFSTLAAAKEAIREGKRHA